MIQSEADVGKTLQEIRRTHLEKKTNTISLTVNVTVVYFMATVAAGSYKLYITNSCPT